MRHLKADHGFTAILVIIWLAIIAAALVLVLNVRKSEPEITFPTSTTKTSTTTETPESLPQLDDLAFAEGSHGGARMIYKGPGDMGPCSKYDTWQHVGAYTIDSHEVVICTSALNDIRSRIYAYKLVDRPSGEEYISGFLTLKRKAQPEAYVKLYGGYYSASSCRTDSIPAFDTRRINESSLYTSLAHDPCVEGYSMQSEAEKTMYYRVSDDFFMLFQAYEGTSLPLIGG